MSEKVMPHFCVHAATNLIACLLLDKWHRNLDDGHTTEGSNLSQNSKCRGLDRRTEISGYRRSV